MAITDKVAIKYVRSLPSVNRILIYIKMRLSLSHRVATQNPHEGAEFFQILQCILHRLLRCATFEINEEQVVVLAPAAAAIAAICVWDRQTEWIAAHR